MWTEERHRIAFTLDSVYEAAFEGLCVMEEALANGDVVSLRLGFQQVEEAERSIQDLIKGELS